MLDITLGSWSRAFPCVKVNAGAGAEAEAEGREDAEHQRHFLVLCVSPAAATLRQID